MSSLQYKLSLTEDQLQSTQEDLRKQLEEALARIDKLEAESRLLSEQRDKAVHESMDLKEKCRGQSTSIDALTQQIARSVSANNISSLVPRLSNISIQRRQ